MLFRVPSGPILIISEFLFLEFFLYLGRLMADPILEKLPYHAQHNQPGPTEKHLVAHYVLLNFFAK